eukprot:1537709-Karenia_brevis.AAC.1
MVMLLMLMVMMAMMMELVLMMMMTMMLMMMPGGGDGFSPGRLMANRSPTSPSPSSSSVDWLVGFSLVSGWLAGWFL